VKRLGVIDGPCQFSETSENHVSIRIDLENCHEIALPFPAFHARISQPVLLIEDEKLIWVTVQRLNQSGDQCVYRFDSTELLTSRVELVRVLDAALSRHDDRLVPLDTHFVQDFSNLATI
jgi:hypothetical protein